MKWQKIQQTASGKYTRWVLIIAGFTALPWIITVLPFFGANNYTYSQLNLWLILAIVCLGLNLLTGVAGQISLGHAALFQIGAYIGGYFVARQGWPVWLVIIVAGLGTGIAGLILGLPALRLSGPYLAVATFGFSVAIPQLLAGSQDIAELYSDPNELATKIGVLTVPKQNLPGLKADDDLGRYFMFLLVFLIMLVLALNINRSRHGRAFYAIRDSETAATAMGVALGKYKLLAFIVSAVYAGVAGSLFAFQVGQLDANSTSFSVLASILFLTAIIIGGLGSVWGSVLGSAVITILPPFISAVNDTIKAAFGSSIENFESIFYGLLILIFIYFMPNGLSGAFQRLRMRYSSDPSKGPATPAEPAATDLPVS
ncbi:MAG: inner-rane translocator [Chloroflexi bacterium]|jgi:branched-chain amino acid transport system permease protein|nr:inner-rane translocator [Chloroflexota bacterium]